MAPRPRFQFKARSKPSQPVKDDRRILGKPPISQPSASPTPSTPQPTQKDYNAPLRSSPALVKRPSFTSAKTISLTSHTNLHAVLPPSASAATSYGDLSNLTACVIDMSAPTTGDTPFSGLALKNMRRCVVVTGNVEGAVHVTGVSDAVLVVASRQVRIHECEGVDFYLHCSSHPIIEDCRNVRFAPVPGCHVRAILLLPSPLSASLVWAGANAEKTPPWSETHENQWDQVDDFKWLKADHSPNWSVLPEDERLEGAFWTDDVAAKTGTGVEDVLKKAGIIS